jgi:ribosomal protein S18 acetylase RimI-like enzyme
MPDEVTVVHLLGVHPAATGRGFGREMVRAALTCAARQRQKAVRLDVIEGNLAAAKLYEKIGFRRVAILPMYYEDTGWRNFMLYEFALEGFSF